jgi:hypothetical protein
MFTKAVNILYSLFFIMGPCHLERVTGHLSHTYIFMNISHTSQLISEIGMSEPNIAYPHKIDDDDDDPVDVLNDEAALSSEEWRIAVGPAVCIY